MRKEEVMLIKIGNIFESNAKTLVNTVNCVGVMGKGIALDFKKKYPDMFKEYVQKCEAKDITPGIPYLYTDLYNTSIINFPTKDHWRSPSKLSYIISGLNWFRDNYESLGITSIAFPPLGCGNGGLSWSIVGPVMYSMLHDLPIEIEIYAPYGTAPDQLTVKYLTENLISSSKEVLGNKNISFNKNWLLLLDVVQKLNQDKYALNVGRTIFQKICYILTRTGIQTGFNFTKGSYGPYAKEVKNAIMVLSNANLMAEKKFGSMMKVVVSSSYQLPTNDFTKQELFCVDKAVDLMSRIRSTEQAELIATVLFSFDELKKRKKEVSDEEILEYVIEWKPHWKNEKKKEIMEAINNLSSLGWMKPKKNLYDFDVDDGMYQ